MTQDLNSFEGYQIGKAHERERILELLRDLRARAQKDKGVTTNININSVIALIKGGQK